jgi:hypothetical protein
MMLSRMSIKELLHRLADIERRAGEASAVNFADDDSNQARKSASTLASWLRAYIKMRIDEQHNG